MAKMAPLMDKRDLDELVRQYLAKKEKSPSRIFRTEAYAIWNQIFRNNQRDAAACTCWDRDVDGKVYRYLLHNYVFEPEPKKKRKYTRKKKNETTDK